MADSEGEAQASAYELGLPAPAPGAVSWVESFETYGWCLRIAPALTHDEAIWYGEERARRTVVTDADMAYQIAQEMFPGKEVLLMREGQ